MAVRWDNASDDLSGTLPQNGGGTNTPTLAMIWLNFSGITPGLGLWGQNSFRCVHHPTTSGELQFAHIAATTSWTWDTSGLGLTTGKWYFIAALDNSETGTDTANMVAWFTEGVEVPPQELTLTQTNGSGNITNPGTAVIYGAWATSGSSADLKVGLPVMFCNTNGAATGGAHAWQVTTTGAITNTTKEIVYRQHVLPFWEGRLRVPSGVYTTLGYNYAEGPMGTVTVIERRTGTSNNASPTIATSTVGMADTEERCPRAYTMVDPHLLWVRR